MLEQLERRMAVALSAKYFENDRLAEAVAHAAETDEYKAEFAKLTAAINRVNSAAQTPQNDPDLTNISKLESPLPLPFAWSDREERKRWTLALLGTFKVINEEIETGYYTDPDKLETKSRFRFFLWDGYARWQAILPSDTRNLEVDREKANIVVNALCEATVLLAEDGNIEAKGLLDWMNDQKWIEEKWEFSPEVVERAHRIGN